MKKELFYRQYANLPLDKRYNILTHDFNSPVGGRSLTMIYEEIKNIDERIRPNEIRREELLREVEKYFKKR